MIKIKFEKKYGLKKKSYLIVDGLEILADMDESFVKSKQVEKLFIELFDTKNKEFGYKGYFELGMGNGDYFLEWLENILYSKFPENHEEIKEMVKHITEEIAQHALSIKASSEIQNQTRKRSSLLLSGLIVFLLLVGGWGTYLLMNTQLISTTNVAQTREIWEKDLQALDPKEIGDKYPDRLEEIAEYYKKQRKWETLKIFQEIYPTENGTFDLAFYEHDWDTVIQTDVTRLTGEKKVMLCYAYIKQNLLSEAELLANKLDSNQLNEALDYAYLCQVGKLIKEKQLSEAEGFGKKIKSTTLQKEYQEAFDSVSIMNDMIDLYQKQKDTKNQKIWERRLDDLGTELEERGMNE